MSEPVDSEIHESRTQSFQGKRTLIVAEGEDSSASTPSKRSRRSRRGRQQRRDFVPLSGSFSTSDQLPGAAGLDAENRSDSSGFSAHDSESHRAIGPDMDGSTNGHSTIWPRLPSDRPILGQNRLATGFAKDNNRSSTITQAGEPQVSRNDFTSYNSIGESAEDAIEISDDGDMEGQSEDGGMMINVDDGSEDGDVTPEPGAASSQLNQIVGEARNQASPRNESPLSDGEIKQTNKQQDGRSGQGSNRRKGCTRCGERDHQKRECSLHFKNLQIAPNSSTQIHMADAHEQMQDDPNHALSPNATTMSNTSSSRSQQRLGDLSTDEFEKQIRYTLFHLQRDQVDLNRPAICLTCLQPGHEDANCPESNCVHCGIKNAHPSRLCPAYRRCLKCRERGHDIDTCVSKLKNTTVPCDYCGSKVHVEDSCPFRFFPSHPQASATGTKLWISCCMCASKTHLVGDCPERRASTQPAAWSLRSLDPMQISNLSLASGTRQVERAVEIRGGKQQGLMIKGHADTYGNAPPFLRSPVGKQNSPRRGGRKGLEERDNVRIRSRTAATSSHDFQEDFYHPAADSRSRNVRNDGYEPSYKDYRGQSADRRDNFYATNSFGQRRRSRSPEFRDTRAALRNGNFQPPLPKEPLPSRPPPASHRGSRTSAPSNRMPDRGPPGIDSYRPMPSAAKQAWNKFRL